MSSSFDRLRTSVISWPREIVDYQVQGSACERRARRNDLRSGFVRRRGQDRQVAHLAAGPRKGLTVQVKLDTRTAERCRPLRLTVIPEIPAKTGPRRRLEHPGRSDRKPAAGAQL